jgi:hypothetical protein
MKLTIGDRQVTVIGPGGIPLNQVATFDFSECRGRLNPFRREIQRENRAIRMTRKRRRGWV